jgi:hypothetical protein
VYAKPGHFATRYVTNASLNILQGAASPLGIAKTARLAHALTDREALQVAALGGQGYVHAIFDGVEGKNALSGAAGKAAGLGAKFWGHQDTPFRFNAVAYEMRKLGFNTPEKVKELLANPDKYRAQLDEIGKRANRENIAYDNLSTREKQVVSRVFWFYPWLKGATQYGGRLVYEHPIKAGLIGNLGTIGQQQAQKDLGPVPSREAGLFKVGGTHDHPVASLPNTLNALHTPASILESALGMLGGHFGTPAAEIGGMLTPAIRAGEAVANKTDQYGTPTPHASVGKILEQQLVGGSPEVLAYTRLRDLGYLKDLGIHPATPKDIAAINQAVKAGVISKSDAALLVKAVKAAPSKKMFPTNTSEALGMPLAGSWWPGETSLATLNAQAVKEMTPADKLHYELQQALDAHVLTRAEVARVLKTAGP